MAWYLLGAAAVQLGLGVAIELAAPALRDGPFAQKAAQLAARRAEAPGRPFLLALGSSRTLYGCDAQFLSQTPGAPLAYNFGELAAGPVLEQVFLRRLLAEGVRPDLLLIEVAPLHLAGLRWGDNQMRTVRLSWAEMNVAVRYHYRPAAAYARWLSSRGLACVGSHWALHEGLGVDAPRPAPAAGLGPTDFGFSPLCPVPDGRAARIGSTLGDFARLPDARLGPEARQSVTDLVGLCRREGLTFAVVYMPECAGLRALYPPGFLADLGRLIDDLRRDGEFELIDARAWVADDGFFDGHHLDQTGARAFTARLAAELPRLRHSADPAPRLTADAGAPPFRPPAGAIR